MSEQELQGRKPIVAIDGPAGAGKSTIARHLASRFGLLNLETGAMYRAFALKALRSGIALEAVTELAALTATTCIELEPTEAGNRVLLDGEDVTGALREPSVSNAASQVSVHPPIRAWLVCLQQQMGARGGVVMEGRDIGTVVFPNADVKIFLDADASIRGVRRFDQMGAQPPLEVQAVIRDLQERDHRDRNRADSPLKPADDALLLDSSRLSLEETIKAAEDLVLTRIGA